RQRVLREPRARRLPRVYAAPPRARGGADRVHRQRRARPRPRRPPWTDRARVRRRPRPARRAGLASPLVPPRRRPDRGGRPARRRRLGALTPRYAWLDAYAEAATPPPEGEAARVRVRLRRRRGPRSRRRRAGPRAEGLTAQRQPRCQAQGAGEEERQAFARAPGGPAAVVASRRQARPDLRPADLHRVLRAEQESVRRRAARDRGRLHGLLHPVHVPDGPAALPVVPAAHG